MTPEARSRCYDREMANLLRVAIVALGCCGWGCSSSSAADDSAANGGAGSGGLTSSGGTSAKGGASGKGGGGSSGGGSSGGGSSGGSSGGGSSGGGSGGSSSSGGGSSGSGGSSSGGAMGSNGTGGPGPGKSQQTFSGGAYAMYVPPTYDGTPIPLLILLHGQGDTGKNFLDYWLSKGYATDRLIAAPDVNTDANTVALYDHLRTTMNVDLQRGYVFGHSQGGAYATFLLFSPPAANRFAGIALNSSGLAQNPSSIPAATVKSPAVAICIDPNDPNNTGSLDGSTHLHIMEDFSKLMMQKGYVTQLTLHNQGHTIPSPETSQVLAWLFGHVAP